MDVSKPLLEGHKDYLDDVDTFSIKKKYQDRTCTSRMCQNCMQPWAILKDSDWFCWRFFVMETKIRDYDDFASSEQVYYVLSYSILQKRHMTQFTYIRLVKSIIFVKSHENVLIIPMQV
jgi:hypothetical protein